MNRYLVYLASTFHRQPGGMEVLLESLRAIGKIAQLDEQLFIVETKLHGPHIQQAIERVRIGRHNYLVTDIRRLGFGGTQAFADLLGVSEGSNYPSELDLTVASNANRAPSGAVRRPPVSAGPAD